jgi:UDP-N-acetyl-D-mannosaminuronic acid transferase (WecB/TagA/CpsF family)
MHSDDAAGMSYAKILGVQFFCRPVSQAVDHFLAIGGLLVVPASPALTKLRYSDHYRKALFGADLALLDSGLVVTAWKIMTGRAVSRISGTRYLQTLSRHAGFRCSPDVLWIVSSEALAQRARGWLNNQGYEEKQHRFHICSAAHIGDHELLLKIEQHRPPHIIVATSGGTQEKLGLYLRDYLLYRPCIHCVGNGLAFLTGLEKPIPKWAETARLGWFFRLVAQPRMILPRIGIAIAVLSLLFRNRSEAPALQPRWADL